MEQTTVDLRDIVKMLKRRRILIINLMLGSVFIALLIGFLVPPTYEAETTLRVKQSKGLANSLLDEIPISSPLNTKQLMLTYAETLKSRTVVQSVIDQTQTGKAEIPKYEDMVKRITTQPVKDTELLKIKVEAKSPEEAQLLANTLVATFYDRLLNLVRSEQANVRDFIAQRVQESKIELEKAETALEQYKRQQKITAPADDAKAIIDRQAYVKRLAAENAVNSAMAQAKFSTAQQQLATEKPGFVADSPLIQQSKIRLADLEVELVGLSQSYGDSHPRVLALKASINDAKKKLNTEVAQVIQAEAPSMNPIHQGLLQSRIQAEAEMAATAAQREAINRVMSQADQELVNLPAKEQGITRLTRDAMVAQEIYVTLAKRYEEARISEVMQPTDVQVIDVAIAPERPVAPKKTLNVLVALIIGSLFGVGIAIYLEYVNRTINTVKEAKQFLGLPVLGVIPDFDDIMRSSPTFIIWDKLKNRIFGR